MLRLPPHQSRAPSHRPPLQRLPRYYGLLRLLSGLRGGFRGSLLYRPLPPGFFRPSAWIAQSGPLPGELGQVSHSLTDYLRHMLGLVRRGALRWSFRHYPIPDSAFDSKGESRRSLLPYRYGGVLRRYIWLHSCSGLCLRVGASEPRGPLLPHYSPAWVPKSPRALRLALRRLWLFLRWDFHPRSCLSPMARTFCDTPVSGPASRRSRFGPLLRHLCWESHYIYL